MSRNNYNTQLAESRIKIAQRGNRLDWWTSNLYLISKKAKEKEVELQMYVRFNLDIKC